MAKLADLSFAPITGAQLKAAGYSAVGRYLSHSPGKNLTPAQRDDYFANGLGIFLFWEDAAQRALAGFSAGADDARVALSQANTLGLPNNRPIYFTADFDATEAQQDNINAYLDGAASVLGFSRVGVYGDYYVVKRALDARKAKWSIQTRAWSGTPILIDPRIHIFQTAERDFNDQVDIDESKQDDFGQWTLGNVGGGGENMVTPQDRIVEAFNNLVGRDPSDAELAAWNSAGQPEPRGWAQQYILGDRHSDVFHQLEQALSVHDAFDLPRLEGLAKQEQSQADQVIIKDLQDKLAALSQPMPTATLPGLQTSEGQNIIVAQLISFLVGIGALTLNQGNELIQVIGLLLAIGGPLLGSIVSHVDRTNLKVASITGR